MREIIIDNPRKAREAVNGIIKQYGSVEVFFQHHEIAIERGTPTGDIYRLIKYIEGKSQNAH